MYARVFKGNVEPGRVDEAIRIYLNLEATLRGLRGWSGSELLLNRGEGEAISVTYWDTPEDMEYSLSSGVVADALRQFAGVLSSRPDREEYEVVVQLKS